MRVLMKVVKFIYNYILNWWLSGGGNSHGYVSSYVIGGCLEVETLMAMYLVM